MSWGCLWRALHSLIFPYQKRAEVVSHPVKARRKSTKPKGDCRLSTYERFRWILQGASITSATFLEENVSCIRSQSIQQDEGIYILSNDDDWLRGGALFKDQFNYFTVSILGCLSCLNSLGVKGGANETNEPAFVAITGQQLLLRHWYGGRLFKHDLAILKGNYQKLLAFNKTSFLKWSTYVLKVVTEP